MHASDTKPSSDRGVTIGWLGRSALLAAAFFPVLGLYGFGVALPPISAAFSGTPHAVLLSQLLGSIVGLAFALGSPVVGRLTDRYGCQSVLLASSALFAIMGAAGGVLNDLYAILVTRALLGFTVAGALLASLTAIGQMSAAERPKMYGYQALVGGSMAIAIYPLVGWFASMGWRWPFALHLVGLLVLPLALGLPKKTTQAEPHASNEPSGRFAGVPVTMLLVAMFMGIAGVAGSLFSPFFLTQIGITSPTQQSIPLMAMGIAGIFASGAYGWLHQRVGTDGSFAAALVVFGSGLIVAALSHSLLGLTVALAINALGMATYMPNLSAAVVAVVKRNQGRALGLASGAMYGAQALFPFIGNGISQFAGPAAVFGVLGAAATVIGLAYGIGMLNGARAKRMLP